MSSLFSVFTLFYLVLENMSINVRKFSFSCYIGHLVPPIVLYLVGITLFEPKDKKQRGNLNGGGEQFLNCEIRNVL